MDIEKKIREILYLTCIYKGISAVDGAFFQLLSEGLMNSSDLIVLEREKVERMEAENKKLRETLDAISVYGNVVSPTGSMANGDVLKRGIPEVAITVAVHQPPAITFGDNIGSLYLERPLRFEGDADKSARLFIDLMIKQWDEEFKALESRISKAEKVVEAARAYIAYPDGFYAGSGVTTEAQLMQSLKEYGE